MSEIRELKYVGIDDWNRPIFKDDRGNYFGNTEILFNWNATKKEVSEKITEKNIEYFGDHFGCDPMGTLINPNKIKLNYD